jgi:hypothetical protein
VSLAGSYKWLASTARSGIFTVIGTNSCKRSGK